MGFPPDIPRKSIPIEAINGTLSTSNGGGGDGSSSGLAAHASSHLPGSIDALPWTSIHGSGPIADRPGAAPENAGYFWFTTDLGSEALYRSTGSMWELAIPNRIRVVAASTAVIDASTELTGVPSPASWDGVTLVTGDAVLPWQCTDATKAYPWIVNTSGAWTPLPAPIVVGTVIEVGPAGNEFKRTFFVLDNTTDPIIGTSNINFRPMLAGPRLNSISSAQIMNGAVPDDKLGPRTIDPTDITTGNTGSLTVLLSRLARAIWNIVGMSLTNWWTVPPIDLVTAKVHIDSLVSNLTFTMGNVTGLQTAVFNLGGEVDQLQLGIAVDTSGPEVKVGFFGTPPVEQPAALTTANNDTISATYDASVIAIIENMRDRINEMEAALSATGNIAS